MRVKGFVLAAFKLSSKAYLLFTGLVLRSSEIIITNIKKYIWNTIDSQYRKRDQA